MPSAGAGLHGHTGKRDQVGDLAAIERQIANLLFVDQTAHRRAASLDFSAAGDIHDHLLSERAHLHIEIRHQLFGHGELQVDYADLKSLMFGAHFVSADW